MTTSGEHDALVERLRLAQEIVERSELKAELRTAAFVEIVRLLDEPSVERPAPAAEHQEPRPGRARRSESARLAAVAEAFEVEASLLEQVFADDEGELKLVLPVRLISKTTRGAMRQVAILTICARQAGNWDTSWTSAGEVRTVCESINVFSSKHFGAVMDSLDMFSGQGSGSNRQFRAHDGSFEPARQVLTQLGVLRE